MTYPKKLMTITELVKLGYSRSYLDRIAHHEQSHKYIRRTSTAKNSTIRFDTEVLEKLIKSGEVR